MLQGNPTGAKSGKRVWMRTAHLKRNDRTLRFSSFEEIYGLSGGGAGAEDRRQEEVMRRYLDATARNEQGMPVITVDSPYARDEMRRGRADPHQLMKRDLVRE